MKNVILTLGCVFFACSLYAEQQVLRTQYWFNENFNEAVVMDLDAPASSVTFSNRIATASLEPGLHSLHIRFKDSTNTWSSTLSRFFYKLPVLETGSGEIHEVQYWFNRDYEGRITQATDSQPAVALITDIDADDLAAGLHTFHIRFKDGTGAWSSTLSRFFHKTSPRDGLEPEIISYRYWVTEDGSDMTEVPLDAPVDAFTLDTILDMRRLTSSGEYYLSFQFKDSEGRWSSAVTEAFDFLDAYSDWATAHDIEGGPEDLTDGVPNLVRYAMGGDLDTPQAELLPQLRMDPESDAPGVIISFQRIADPRLRYAVWWSEDLVDWGIEPIWSENAPEAPELHELMLQIISERGFLRLGVTRE